MGAKDRPCLHAFIEYCYITSTTACCNYTQVTYAPNIFFFLVNENYNYSSSILYLLQPEHVAHDLSYCSFI